MKSRILISAGMIAGMAMVVAPAYSQILPPTTSQPAAVSQAVDEMKMPALMGGDYAATTSQLALSQSQNPMVLAFAQLEIAEQAAIAMAFGTTSGEAGLSNDHATMLEQLRPLQGNQFDVMYIEGQILGHQELLAIHQTYATSGTDPMARGASMVGVTGIQTHSSMLAAIRESLGRAMGDS